VVPVQIAVPTAGLTVLAGTDDAAARFRVLLAARSTKGEWTSWREREFALTRDELAAPLQQITIQMELERGEHTIGVVVRDEIGSEIAYLALEASPGGVD
jgi:hypothetical protein